MGGKGGSPYLKLFGGGTRVNVDGLPSGSQSGTGPVGALAVGGGYVCPNGFYLGGEVFAAWTQLLPALAGSSWVISLLNSVLSQEDQVSSVEILNPYNLQNFKEEKLSILDIKARGQTGHYYNIEIQVTDAKNYEKR